jgi:hypothetical protein
MPAKFFKILIWLIFFCPVAVYSVMSSTNYTILGDQVGMGADMSQGGNYVLRDSSGALITAGSIDSDTYEIRSGFYFIDKGVLSVSVSPSTISLGTLSTSVVATATTTITVSTDSETGYNLSISSVSAGGLNNVSDAQVTAGSEEFGVAGSGTDCQLPSGTDTSTNSGLLIASHNSAINFSQTNLTFKAAISNSTAAVQSTGKTISFIASANF